MAAHAGAALHGEAIGLVEDDQIFVFVEDHRADVARVFGRNFDRGRLILRIEIERRHAHALALLQARRGFDARAVDPHLTGAHDLVQMRQRQGGDAALEPAVEPEAVLIIADFECLHAQHLRLVADGPARRASPVNIRGCGAKTRLRLQRSRPGIIPLKQPRRKRQRASATLGVTYKTALTSANERRCQGDEVRVAYRIVALRFLLGNKFVKSP